MIYYFLFFLSFKILALFLHFNGEGHVDTLFECPFSCIYKSRVYAEQQLVQQTKGNGGEEKKMEVYKPQSVAYSGIVSTENIGNLPSIFFFFLCLKKKKNV